ncbi:PREDICTED: uncharacterized protein LOC109113919 [Nelumbo nucifera]|uniref:Uncharacterized protein LOC109113919 n=1 Tax=Nelumbo nucifera TaxID=4432 RepID=A0A1U8Q073_NELNU|nr:PREDICTED: uncharacterized protein LOC109113919 [Nelumbo nucifera]
MIQRMLSKALASKRVTKPIKYHGLPASIGKSKKEAFNYIKEKVMGKAQGWKEQLLSQAGKEILIKVVASALSVYSMSCFLLPQAICDDITKAMRQFGWGYKDNNKKTHWIKWDLFCKAKKEGGIGFRDPKSLNLALMCLAKQAWRIVSNPNSLLAMVLKGRYFKNGSFFQATVPPCSSLGWRSLIKGREVLQKGLFWQIGNGNSINFLTDPWLLNPGLQIAITARLSIVMVFSIFLSYSITCTNCMNTKFASLCECKAQTGVLMLEPCVGVW